MKIISSYGAEVLRVGRQLNATTKYYRKTVSYFVAHINETCDDISSISDSVLIGHQMISTAILFTEFI